MFSSDGDWLASYQAPQLIVWNVTEGKFWIDLRTDAPLSKHFSYGFSNDSKYLITDAGTLDLQIKKWIPESEPAPRPAPGNNDPLVYRIGNQQGGYGYRENALNTLTLEKIPFSGNLEFLNPGTDDPIFSRSFEGKIWITFSPDNRLLLVVVDYSYSDYRLGHIELWGVRAR